MQMIVNFSSRGNSPPWKGLTSLRLKWKISVHLPTEFSNFWLMGSREGVSANENGKSGSHTDSAAME
jgi:hypothetical protein